MNMINKIKEIVSYEEPPSPDLQHAYISHKYNNITHNTLYGKEIIDLSDKHRELIIIEIVSNCQIDNSEKCLP